MFYAKENHIGLRRLIGATINLTWTGNVHTTCFAGHTNEEMQLHFYRCVIKRSDELRWMPKIPFRYYMLGFKDYVMAGKFPEFDVTDAATCFLGLVEQKLAKQPQHIYPIMAELLPTIRYVGQNQSRFGATESICGNFRE